MRQLRKPPLSDFPSGLKSHFAHGVSRTNGVLYIFRLQQDSRKPFKNRCTHLCSQIMFCTLSFGKLHGYSVIGTVNTKEVSI